nr:MAG TPA: hypothetical protein [Bacteriophage sp.]
MLARLKKLRSSIFVYNLKKQFITRVRQNILIKTCVADRRRNLS